MTDETTTPARGVIETRQINLAAFALMGGGDLREAVPLGHDRVRFVVDLPDGVTADDLARDFPGSDVARFLSVRERLLDAARATNEREDNGGTRRSRHSETSGRPEDGDGDRPSRRRRGRRRRTS